MNCPGNCFGFILERLHRFDIMAMLSGDVISMSQVMLFAQEEVFCENDDIEKCAR